MIYFDYNATAPLFPKVRLEMQLLGEAPLNASAMHQLGQRARGLLRQARERIAHKIDTHPDYILFTSGGTESNNHALRAVEWDHVFVSAIEHDSVFKAVPHPTIIPVDDQGRVDMAQLDHLLTRNQGHKRLISVIWGNNETGVLNDMPQIVQIARKHGALIHSDASQVVGKIPLSFEKSGLDMMTLTAHKWGGPQGVGALVVRPTVPLPAFLRGGGQENGRRSGTEPLETIVGFGAAALYAPCLAHLESLHRSFEENILSYAGGMAKVIGQKAPRLPNTSYITLEGVPSSTQLMAFDLEGIAVSSGAACSSGRVQHSRVIKAITNSETHAESGIRFSSGWQSTAEDFHVLTRVWQKIFDRTGLQEKAS